MDSDHDTKVNIREWEEHYWSELPEKWKEWNDMQKIVHILWMRRSKSDTPTEEITPRKDEPQQ